MRQQIEKEQYHTAKAHLVAGMGSASTVAKGRSLRRIADQSVECLPALACFSTVGAKWHSAMRGMVIRANCVEQHELFLREQCGQAPQTPSSTIQVLEAQSVLARV
jgi:hypothetical protein